MILSVGLSANEEVRIGNDKESRTIYHKVSQLRRVVLFLIRICSL